MSRQGIARAFVSGTTRACRSCVPLGPARRVVVERAGSTASTTPVPAAWYHSSRRPIRAYSSFWAHSYPSTKNSTQSSQVPYDPPAPPPPNVLGGDPSVVSSPTLSLFQQQRERDEAEPPEPTAKKSQRKQKYLDSLMDKAGELSLKCSILDRHGRWAAEETRYKKSELCRDYDLDPRDLRKLDSIGPNLVPIILTRKTCILISMLHLRALIKPDRVIVFDTAGTTESEVQRRFKWHLEKNIRAGLEEEGEGDEDYGLAYEHRALESVLVATANALEEEMVYSRQLVKQLLADLEDHIERDNLKRLLHYSRRMVAFQSKARYVKRAVDEILESDEDLSAMYLTSKEMGRPRALHDHEQLELMLESFVKQVEEIVSEIDTTVTNINSTQEIAELMLDFGRNALLALDVKLSVATLAVGTGALVVGTFGMNLSSGIEMHPYAFYITTTGATVLCAAICFVGITIMKKLQRVALSGRESSPLRRLMNSHAFDTELARMLSLHPSNLPPRPTRAKWYKRLFGRRDNDPALRAELSARSREASRIREAIEADNADYAAPELRKLDGMLSRVAGGWESSWTNKWARSRRRKHE